MDGLKEKLGDAVRNFQLHLGVADGEVFQIIYSKLEQIAPVTAQLNPPQLDYFAETLYNCGIWFDHPVLTEMLDNPYIIDSFRKIALWSGYLDKQQYRDLINLICDEIQPIGFSQNSLMNVFGRLESLYAEVNGLSKMHLEDEIVKRFSEKTTRGYSGSAKEDMSTQLRRLTDADKAKIVEKSQLVLPWLDKVRAKRCKLTMPESQDDFFPWLKEILTEKNGRRTHLPTMPVEHLLRVADGEKIPPSLGKQK